MNVLAESDWRRIENCPNANLCDVIRDPKLSVRSYAATSNLETICTFKAWIKSISKKKPDTFAEFIVVRGGTRSLLGRQSAMDMRLLAIGLEVNQLMQTTGKFPSIPGIEVEFDVDESVPPVRHAYVSIPAHYREAANDRLRAMENSDIIEPVTTAPRWISGLSAVPKGKSDFRLVINMRGPNKAIQRQFHQMPRVEEIKTKLSGARFFTKLDLQSAFHHVVLAEKSRELTTFMAPNGMYRFKRMAFGVNCAPEIFQRLMENVLFGVPNIIIYIDDILIYAATTEQLARFTEQVMSALRQNNLTINHEKCVHAVETLTFLGHQLSSKGLNIDERKVKDVEGFREPGSAAELRSFLGLASYVSTYIPRFADLTEPLWRVTNKGAFMWGPEQTKAFAAVKSAIMSCTISQGYFDTKDTTLLYTDASPHALGAVLVQKNQQNEHRIVSFASKTLTKTERKYAQTQREALAVVWATEHFYYYLLGQKFTIRTDAQGIAYIFNRNGDAPKRLMRRAEGWAMRLDAFDFDIEFVKGSLNIADPSSRLCTSREAEYEERGALCEINSIIQDVPLEIEFGDEYLPAAEVAHRTATDDTLKAVIKALGTGEWSQEISRYKAVNHELHETNGILMRLGLAVVPESLRRKALTLAHKGHPGMSKMKSILRERVWWPSLGKAVENWVEACRTCTLNGRKDPPTPMQRTMLPEAPWDFVAVDFNGPYSIYNGVYVLSLTDYFTRYMVAMTSFSTSFESTRRCLDCIFDTYGFPGAIKSDHGPPFNSSDYGKYCSDRGIRPIFSWPLTPQQNGMAEKSMQIINKAMQSANVEGRDYRKSLAEAVRAHNTAAHRTTNAVPSDLMFARKLRRTLPLTQNAMFMPDYEELRERDFDEKQRAKLQEDKRRGARDSRIMVGDKVVLRRAVKRKGDSNYDPRELEVTDKRKGDLTMKDLADGHIVKRHITLAKKVHDKAPSKEDEGQKTNETGPTEAVSEAVPGRVLRPRETIKKPEYLRGYVRQIEDELSCETMNENQ